MRFFIHEFICGLILLIITHCDNRQIDCPELPKKALKALLGTTYNARYMRVEPPLEQDSGQEFGGLKRASGHTGPEFYEDQEEDNPYEGIPAWEVDHFEISERRQKRKVESPPTKKRDAREAFLSKITRQGKQDLFYSRPWDCRAEVNWIDLGADYFPRYIRTVECKKKNCWYGHYTCKPKSFSIKVLRRSTNQCAKVNQRFKIVTMGAVEGEYAEQWEFEEKPVTFCCACVVV